MKNFFLARIAEARSLDELNYIVEQASDSIKDNADYEEVYQAAMEKIAGRRGNMRKCSILG